MPHDSLAAVPPRPTAPSACSPGTMKPIWLPASTTPLVLCAAGAIAVTCVFIAAGLLRRSVGPGSPALAATITAVLLATGWLAGSRWRIRDEWIGPPLTGNVPAALGRIALGPSYLPAPPIRREALARAIRFERDDAGARGDPGNGSRLALRWDIAHWDPFRPDRSYERTRGFIARLVRDAEGLLWAAELEDARTEDEAIRVLSRLPRREPGAASPIRDAIDGIARRFPSPIVREAADRARARLGSLAKGGEPP